MPNGLAYLMLLVWPFVCLALFRNLKFERALIWSILGGYLLLPQRTEFNLPLVPAMDKVSIPNLAVVIIILFALKIRFSVLPRFMLAKVLTIGFVLCAIPTVLTNPEPILFRVLANSDPIVFLTDMLPGQSIRDIGSVLIAQMLTLVPFLLARQFLSSEDGLRELLLAFFVGGLAYSIPALIEIRFSPQMNVWVYGFFQHSFAQTIRAGGYRPIVFLPHGLWLALFIFMSIVAAAALARVADKENRARMYGALVYLLVLMVLCKSAGALLFTIALTPLVLFLSPRWQIRAAVVFATIAVVYPMLRNANVIPKPLFGWSGWGRSLVRHPETAEILSIPDGRWIIIFGTFGWLGYICEFGILAFPIFMMGLYILRNRTTPLSPFVGAMILILGATLLDMLINATLTPTQSSQGAAHRSLAAWRGRAILRGGSDCCKLRKSAVFRKALFSGSLAKGCDNFTKKSGFYGLSASGKSPRQGMQ